MDVQMRSVLYTKHLGNCPKDNAWSNKWNQKRAMGDENTIQQFHPVLNLSGNQWVWLQHTQQKKVEHLTFDLAATGHALSDHDLGESWQSGGHTGAGFKAKGIDGVPVTATILFRLKELHSDDAWLKNQDQQGNGMVPKGKEAKEFLGEVALTKIDKLGHGGEEEKERVEEAHTETAATNTQTMESKNLQ
ncbi:hypothetical protein BDD12DRAFT_809427 [Trichophaea hybrida]|nr:hypothetical protein BDD12DRAFT_809427 [Trichophaea hybrida]